MSLYRKTVRANPTGSGTKVTHPWILNGYSPPVFNKGRQEVKLEGISLFPPSVPLCFADPGLLLFLSAGVLMLTEDPPEGRLLHVLIKMFWGSLN